MGRGDQAQQVSDHQRPLFAPGERGNARGAPPLLCFLGVPLSREEQAFGAICVANKPGGYTGKDREFLERLSVAFGMALDHSRAKQAVQTACEYAESIVETIREPLVVLDADLRVLSANRSFYRTFQVIPEETEGKQIYNMGRRQWDIPRLRELLEKILPENTQLQDYELELNFPTIGRRIMILNARRIYREAHKTQMILLAIEDITERKRAEEIQWGRNRVLEQLATGASLVEVLLILVEIAEKNNPGIFCSVLLFDKEKKQLLLGAAPNLPNFYNEAINGIKIGPGVGSCGTAAYTGKRVIVEDIMVHPYWTKFRELAKKAGLRACWSEPIISSSDQILGTFAMYYREPRVPDQSDIEFIKTTAHLAGIAIEKKQTEEELRNAHDELEIKVEERTKELAEANVRLIEASRLKSQFLANMSHELRTPLNSIIGFTGILLQGMSGKLNDEQKKQLNMVYDSAKHLLELINDILDLSKIEAGKIEIIAVEFEVKELVQAVEKMVLPMMEEKGLTFDIAISDDVPPTVYNDKNRIKQVLINLLSNAIKFTESGKIMVNLEFGLGI